MSLKILVDECLQSKSLVQLLRNSGHDVEAVNTIGLTGKPDSEVFAIAISQNRLVLTSNCDDFVELHRQSVENGTDHPGILLVYLNNNVTTDMNNTQIVTTIANLETCKIPLANATHSLVQYNYS